MNWFQKSSQSWSEMHDELGTARDMVGREDISNLKGEAGDIPENTCPLINTLIKSVNDIFRILKYGPNEDNPQSPFDDIESELWSFEDELENIRKHNEQLRNLGEYWYQQYKGLEGQVQELEERLIYCQQQCQMGITP